MSAGDSTFNATLNIKTLLRELSLCNQDGSGYKDGDAEVIVKAIDIIRKRADKMEQEWATGDAPSPPNQFVPWQGVTGPFKPFDYPNLKYITAPNTLTSWNYACNAQ